MTRDEKLLLAEAVRKHDELLVLNRQSQKAYIQELVILRDKIRSRQLDAPFSTEELEVTLYDAHKFLDPEMKDLINIVANERARQVVVNTTQRAREAEAVIKRVGAGRESQTSETSYDKYSKSWDRPEPKLVKSTEVVIESGIAAPVLTIETSSAVIDAAKAKLAIFRALNFIKSPVIEQVKRMKLACTEVSTIHPADVPVTYSQEEYTELLKSANDMTVERERLAKAEEQVEALTQQLVQAQEQPKIDEELQEKVHREFILIIV